MPRTTVFEPEDDSPDHHRIHALLTDWHEAITRRDQASYVRCYSRDFLGDERRRERLETFSGLDHMDGELRDIRVQLHDRELAKVGFRVHQTSGAAVTREMLLVREDDCWRIGAETVDQQAADDADGQALLRGRLKPLTDDHQAGRLPRGAPGQQRSRHRYLRFGAITVNILVGGALLLWLAAQFSPGIEAYLSRKYRALTNQPLWTLERDRIDSTLRDWAQAIARKDVDAYLTHYSTEFFGDDPEARRRWETGRRPIIGREGPVEVAIGDIELQPGASEDVVRAYVRQHYRVTEADYLLDKRLVLKKEAGGWRIIAERTRVADRSTNTRPAMATTTAPPGTTPTTPMMPANAAGDRRPDAGAAPNGGEVRRAVGSETPPPAESSPPQQALYQARAEIATHAPAPTDSGRQSPDDDAAQVVRTARAWAAAWSRGAVDEYLSFYGDNFRPAGGQSRSQWQRTRRGRLSRPKWIEIGLSDFVTRPVDGNHVELTVKQAYRSNTFADLTRKVLLFERVADRWLIVSERALQ